MFHPHMAYWVIGAPSIDKVEVPQEKAGEGQEKPWVEFEVVPEGATVAPQSEAGDRLAAFWGRGFTEFNFVEAISSKTAANLAQSSGVSAWTNLCALTAGVGVRTNLTKAEQNGVRSPEFISYEAHAHCLLHGFVVECVDDERCWYELQKILQ